MISQKKHFKQKLEGIQKMIWDYTFNLNNTRATREEIRQEYDNDKSKLSVLASRIESQGMLKDKRFDDSKVLLEKEILSLENQMKAIDTQINGSKPTEQYPDGVRGLNGQIDSLVKLQNTVKEYIKQM